MTTQHAYIQLALMPQLAKVGKTTGPGRQMRKHADGHRLDSIREHIVSRASNYDSSISGVEKIIIEGSPIIFVDKPVGSRKALAKKAEASRAVTGTPIKSEALVECWDVEQQSVSIVPASSIKELYNARKPLLPAKSQKQQLNIVFPLCPDHLITLLQFNVLRALAVNRALISGILTKPLDCGEEAVHVVPYPANSNLLPSTLLPTTLQQTIPHDDWIDVFPSPEGRDRLIRAAGSFDEDELWADCIGGLYEGFPDDEVERRGIIAWSPPWDIAGWEMSEGFLRKWGWLVKGLPGYLTATNRWRVQRGEEPFHDDDCSSHEAAH